MVVIVVTARVSGLFYFPEDGSDDRGCVVRNRAENASSLQHCFLLTRCN